MISINGHDTDSMSLDEIATHIRGTLVEMSCETGASHLGSALSCTDFLVAAYWEMMDIDPENPDDPDRDRLILSKGHAAAALYASLAYKGFITEETLNTYNVKGEHLVEHPSPNSIPGLEAATGSLGHGLSIGLGMALCARQTRGFAYDVYVVMSDGECNEGSTWEAAMMAPKQNLGNVTALVDFNKWQGTARSEETLQLEPLKDKWESCGWLAYEVDGHNLNQILNAMEKGQKSDKPVAIVGHTVKGKGISFMEDDNNWHYRVPDKEEVKLAKEELGLL